jgi:hypothetical protein
MLLYQQFFFKISYVRPTAAAIRFLLSFILFPLNLFLGTFTAVSPSKPIVVEFTGSFCDNCAVGGWGGGTTPFVRLALRACSNTDDTLEVRETGV